MKTNQVMTRPMGNFKVQQRTKDGMFNATDLVKQWNEFVVNAPKKECLKNSEIQENVNTQNFGYVKKDLDDYFANKSTQEYITTIMEREGKDKNLVYVKTRARADRGGGTWMHPMLFLDLAMWLNPSFKYDVIKFIQDQMIAYRNEAGDAYRELSSAVQTLQGQEDMQHRMKFVAKALNYLTFGASEPAIRNSFGTETSQKNLLQRERHIAQLINEGFIPTFELLKDYLRRCWVKEKFI